jgi:hypothetical protein
MLLKMSLYIDEECLQILNYLCIFSLDIDRECLQILNNLCTFVSYTLPSF